VFSARAARAGLMIGCTAACMVAASIASIAQADNPGYPAAVALVSAVMIAGVHRLMGRDDGSDIRSGAGVVACAVALIVLKAQIG
jgi:hypothetical protein